MRCPDLRVPFAAACTGLLLILAMAGSMAGVFADPQPSGPVVKTSGGPVRGLTDAKGLLIFRGIRYGAPPTGEFRFRPPRKPDPWSEVADATRLGNRAIQAPGAPGVASDAPAMSEDCLFLNVWTPAADRKKRPVMVWLHGGGFSSGSGGDAINDAGNLARIGDVVVVAVNHRLNVFGFLQLGRQWGPDYASSGQSGMLDIVLSLEWVRDNIAAFGGNPGNITIFGESGGGRKVAMLMAMTKARGLFHKAIIQSGAGLDAPSAGEAAAYGRELLKKLGIAEGDVRALARTDAMAIFKAQPPASASASPPGKLFMPTGGFVPCVDLVALTRQPFIPDAPGFSAKVPLLIGSNKDEMTIFRAQDPKLWSSTDLDFEAYVRKSLPEQADELIPALRAAFPGYSPAHLITAAETMKGYWMATAIQAERKARQGTAPVYAYLLAWETPVSDRKLRSHHALDLPLVFNNVENSRSMVGPGPDPQRVADAMSSAWVAFARTGNPNAEGLPHWPRYDLKDRSTMFFDVMSRVRKDPYREIRKILMKALE